MDNRACTPSGESETYIHHVPGRLRVRSSAVRRNEVGALRAAAWLRSLPGVSSADANPLTGSLTLRYDPALTGSGTLLEALQEAGYVSRHVTAPATLPARPARRSTSDLGGRLARGVAAYALEKALEHSVLALVGALL